MYVQKYILKYIVCKYTKYQEYIFVIHLKIYLFWNICINFLYFKSKCLPKIYCKNKFHVNISGESRNIYS